MGANEIQQSLLESMKLLSQKAADSTNAAITIKGEIIEELDSGLHQYAVSYGGTTYKDVYSLGNTAYPKSTIVYILIPDGNFDEPKIILKAASASVTNYVTETESDIYIPISSNLFGIENSIDLQSWVDRTQILDLDTSNFGIIFQDYLKTYRNFVFSAYVKTEIDKDHQSKGNYGLILNLPFIQTGAEGASSKIWKSYIMDVSTMQGTPYAFNEYNKIDLYYTVDDTLEYDTNRTPFISAFTQDFGYTEPRTDIQYDIHIKNISMKMIDVLSETDTTGYYLSVVPTEGNYFLDGKYVNKKTLSPLLKVNAKTTSTKDWDCYWFVEDSSIDITKEGYLPIGGLGWKCLNKKTNITYDSEGNKTFQYVTTNQTLEVNDTDVISSLRYKCVLVKDSIIVGGSVRLKNLNSRIEISLTSATGSNTFIESIGNVRLIARIYYPGVTDVDSPSIGLLTQWQRFDKDNNYIDNDFYSIVRWNDKVDDCYETEISYPTSILEKLNTVNCTFYRTITSNGTVVQNNLGTASIIVTTTKEMTYGVTIDNGDVLYKYDADGDSPMVANYDGPASSQIKTIKPITFRVFKPDGSELNEIEYLYAHYKWSFPKNSMMKLASGISHTSEDDDYYYIEGWGTSSINYTILPTYNKKKNNNSILLSIDFNGKQISESANPKFLKDGEGGTNGSKYAAVLTYQDYAYGERDNNGKIRKLQAVWVPNDWKIYDIANNKLVNFGSPTLSPIVYRDGERITSEYYRVSWSMFDSTQTDPCFGVVNGIIQQKDSGKWTDTTKVYCSIVECAITITENSRTNSQEVIYAYYPIEITRLLNSSMANKIIPNLDGGFEEVVYASDGTNPQYDNTNDFVCIDNIYNDDAGDYYDYYWYSSLNLGNLGQVKEPSPEGPSKKIKPVTKFDNGSTKNFIKVVLRTSASRQAEIQTKINELTSQINTVQDKINFYQHNRSHILDFVKKFEYNNYEEKLKNAKQLFNYRYELINYIPKLREILEELNTYCINNGIRIADFNYTEYYSLYNSTLNTAYRNLYLLGYSRTLSDISDLDGTEIKVNIDLLTQNYNAAVAQQINSLVVTWKTLIDKYQEVYVKLVQQSGQQYVLQDEYDSLASFDEELEDFISDSNLSYLIISHDNNDPEPEFVQLHSQLSAWYNQISNHESGELTSYSAFVNDLLKPIEDVLAIYKNTTYQENYYNDINTRLNTQLTSLQNQKSSYEAMLLPASSNYIVHIKPIVMLFNRYELSNINGWDGSKLYIDSQNNEYLLAPQVGAGAKNRDGTFTGVIMGVKQFNAKSTQHIGLFGYSGGVQSFFANAEDGSFIMGKSGSGQIIVDPSQSKAYLYSSTYWKKYNDNGKPDSYESSNRSGKGMLIDLTTPLIHLADASGKIYSGDHIALNSIKDGFYLSQDGFSVGSGFIVAASGQSTVVHENSNLGNWTVRTVSVKDENGNDSNKLCITSKNDTEGIFLDSANSTIVLGSSSGRIYSGKHYKLDSTESGFYLANDGISIGKYFTIYTDGRVTANHQGSSFGQWQLQGDEQEAEGQRLISRNAGITLDAPNSTIRLDSTNGKIYSGEHEELTSQKVGFHLSNQGLSIGSKVYIDQTGLVRLGQDATVAHDPSKSKKHWTISAGGTEESNYYSYIGYNTSSFNCSNLDEKEYDIGGGNNQIYLGTNGIRLGNKFAVDNDGNLVAKHIIANSGGLIGGWTISQSGLSAGGINISSEGSISATGWSISGDGTATFNKLYASNEGTIGGWKIGSNSLTGSDLVLGTGKITGPNFALGSTGLTFTSGGTSITAGGGTSLTESSTKVGSKGIKTYVEDLVVGKITADYIEGKIADINIVRMKGLSVTESATIMASNLKVDASGTSLEDYINNVAGGKVDKNTYTGSISGRTSSGLTVTGTCTIDLG